MTKKRALTLTIGKPFKSAAKDCWIFRYTTLDGVRHEVKRKVKAEIEVERDRIKNQIAISGGSGSYDFALIARFRALEAKAKEANIPIDQLIASAMKLTPSAKNSSTIATAIDEYLEIEFANRYEPTTQSTNRSSLMKFRDLYGLKSILSFTEDDVFEFANHLKSTVSRLSTKREMTTIKAFFDWAAARGRKLIEANPFAAWKIEEFWPWTKDEKSRRTGPKILAPEQVERLILTCLVYDPDFLPALVLQVYGFLRSCEVRRIEAVAIDLDRDTIHVGPNVAKKGKNGKPRPRAIQGLGTAFSLLMSPFKGTDGRLKCLDVKNFHARKSRLFELALPGFGKLENELRHTCATYAYVSTKNIGLVRQNMGHRSASEFVTWEHYVNPTALNEAAEAFFAIRPPSSYSAQINAHRAKAATSAPRWPSDGELKKLALKLPKTKIAEFVGVSETAVRKKFKALGIASPPKGHWQKLAAFQSKLP